MHGFSCEPSKQDFGPIGPEKDQGLRTHMEEKSTDMGAKDDRYRRDHERWRAEHAEAISVAG